MRASCIFFPNAIFPRSSKKANPQRGVQCKRWLTFPNSLRPGVESWVLFVSPTEQTALPRKYLLECRFAASPYRENPAVAVLAFAFSPFGHASRSGIIFSKISGCTRSFVRIYHVRTMRMYTCHHQFYATNSAGRSNFHKLFITDIWLSCTYSIRCLEYY